MWVREQTAGHRSAGRRSAALVVALALGSFAVACSAGDSSGSAGDASNEPSGTTPATAPGEGADTLADTADAGAPSEVDPPTTGSASATSVVGEPSAAGAAISIDGSAEGTPIDDRVFGTNLPAWITPDILDDEEFQRATIESGTTLLRMPGGSWSNHYDWLGCELEDDQRCDWTWAASPSDFIDFLRATDIPGSWTVSFNDTAQAAAAAVAFFNGDVDDDTVIGPDRNGVDWETVGHWAQLRSDNGNAEPIGIQLWEVGNEIFGASPESAGPGCVEWGWENVWTCDGASYVAGDDEHDGYLAFHEAMTAVDPSIEIAAVGTADPAGWDGFGQEVIDGAGSALGVYVVHEYPFDESPDPETAIRVPSETWPAGIESLRDALDGDVAIALTEYNLVSFEDGDTAASMTTAANGLFLAETLGALVEGGVEIANQWNLANGTAGNGTDYGMIRVDQGSALSPQYQAMAMWSQAGDELLPATGGDDDVHVYATRHDDGTLSIIVVNLSAQDLTRTFDVGGVDGSWTARRETVRTDDLTATEMVAEPPVDLGSVGQPLEATLPGWSINVIEVGGDG